MKIKEYKLLDKRYKDNLEGSDKRWEKITDFYYRGAKNKESIKGLSVAFPSKYQDEITLTKIEAEGLCPHHFLPTHYRAELTYVPNGGHVVGTSKAYMAFRTIVAQPILMEDIFIEFFDEFKNRVTPKKLKLTMWGRYECNHKDEVSREAEVVLSKTYEKGL